MPQSTFISPENHWTLWAILLTVAALGILAGNTRWGARLSAAVISIAGGFLLSNLTIIPVAAPAYDVVWSYFVPLAIPLLLLKADIRRILKEVGPTLIAFGIGAVGAVAGTVVAFHLLPLGEEGWKLAAIFCSTYIGASANIQAVLKVGPILFLFAAVILSVHLLFLLGFGKLFKLDLAEMVIASNANMGGPTTAAAMAVARKWQSLVIPAILCGTLGYAVATFIGVAVGFWLK